MEDSELDGLERLKKGGHLDDVPDLYSALLEVWERTQKDGFEHLIAIRDGKIVARVEGDENAVQVGDALGSGAIKDGDIIVHSHPSYTSLSDQDLMLGSRMSSTIFAITLDKSVYRARAHEHAHPIMLARLVEQIWGTLHKVDTLAQKSSFGKSMNSSHWINQVLEDHKLIQYDFSLSPKTAEFVREVGKRLTITTKEGK